MTTRCCLVGTAPSWVKTPWADPSVRIIGLNDLYMLGIKRADEWYDLHPLDHFVFRTKAQHVIDPATIPSGYYVRPEGHVEWLQARAQTIPVWLQSDPPAGWSPNAQRLPVEMLREKYGAYWASGPTYMVWHLYDRGFREFQIYGIHLATQHEYIEQRGNFEFALGRLLGPSYRETRADGRRYFDGADVRVVLPQESPLLQHGWQYAYEPKPQPKPNPYRDELRAVRKEKHALVHALVKWPTGQDKTRALARLKRLEIVEQDCAQQLARAQGFGTLTVSMKVA